MIESDVSMNGCDTTDSVCSSFPAAPWYAETTEDDSDESVEESFCVIRDFSGTSRELKVEMVVPLDMTVREFVRQVSYKFGFEPESIKLVSPCSDRTAATIFMESTEGTLADSGAMRFEKNSRNLFIVEGITGGSPRISAHLISSADDFELGASASPTEEDDSPTYDVPPPPPSPSLALTPYVPLSYNNSLQYSTCANSSEATTSSDVITTYKGLVNQAMTCYLNSLLQVLYMTPEFRNAVYNWQCDPDAVNDPSSSIPYQLQKLFLNLQTSSRYSIETVGLTESFGWDGSDTWHQHDIQELCRVMFDALELQFRGTEQENLIKELYEGKMLDYVKCLECGSEHSREVTFLDVALAIRSHSTGAPYRSVEEALRAFVSPEILDGNNQYYCDNCQTKRDAQKGLRFQKFPYIVCLHLMRFDFDPTYSSRIKLNDRVTFPRTLDLTSFVPEDESEFPDANLPTCNGDVIGPKPGTGSIPGKCDDGSEDSGSAIEEVEEDKKDGGDLQHDSDEGIDVRRRSKHDSESSEGSLLYDLFGIMVHSGSASGGHYYAYIKDFSNGEWICFNDQYITRAKEEDLQRMYGGTVEGLSGYITQYSPSTNAYMLMYRKIDPLRNSLPMTVDQFPEHLKEMMSGGDESMENENRKAKRRVNRKVDLWKGGRKNRYSNLARNSMDSHKIRVRVNHPTFDSLYEPIKAKVEVQSTTTLEEVLQMAYNKLQLDSVVPIDCCRLVAYADNSQTLAEIPDEENWLTKVVNMTGNKFELFVDIKQPGEEFVKYRSGDIFIKVFKIDLETNSVKPLGYLRVNRSESGLELFERLQNQFHAKPVIVKYFYPITSASWVNLNRIHPVTVKTHELSELDIEYNDSIYVCFENSNIKSSYFKNKIEEQIKELITQHQNTRQVTFAVPIFTPERLKLMQIPTLEEFRKELFKNDLNMQEYRKIRQIKESDEEARQPLLPASTVENENICAVDPPKDKEENYLNLPNGHHSDQSTSTSEDSSLSDSDRTITGDVPDEVQMMVSSPLGTSPHYDSDQKSTPLLGNYPRGLQYLDDDEYKNYAADNEEDNQQPSTRPFHFQIKNQFPTTSKKILNVELDSRMPVTVLKSLLEEHVGIPSLYFNLVPALTCYSEPTELTSLEEATDIVIRVTRGPKCDEFRGKFYLFNLETPWEPRYLLEWNFARKSSVGDTKVKVIEELSERLNMEIALDRCRLRKKSQYGPGRVYNNNDLWCDVLGDSLSNTVELYVQVLSEPEQPLPPGHICMLVRRYWPANHDVESSCDELIVDYRDMASIKEKISELTDIEVNSVHVGRAKFSHGEQADYRVSIYEQKNLSQFQIDWDYFCTNEGTALYEIEDYWQMDVHEDGLLLYYRDIRDTRVVRHVYWSQSSRRELKIRPRNCVSPAISPKTD